MRARIKYAYAQNSTGRAQCGLSGGAQKRALTCTANTAGSQCQCQCQLPTADCLPTRVERIARSTVLVLVYAHALYVRMCTVQCAE